MHMEHRRGAMLRHRLEKSTNKSFITNGSYISQMASVDVLIGFAVAGNNVAATFCQYMHIYSICIINWLSCSLFWRWRDVYKVYQYYMDLLQEAVKARQ